MEIVEVRNDCILHANSEQAEESGFYEGSEDEELNVDDTRGYGG